MADTSFIKSSVAQLNGMKDQNSADVQVKVYAHHPVNFIIPVTLMEEDGLHKASEDPSLSFSHNPQCSLTTLSSKYLQFISEEITSEHPNICLILHIPSFNLAGKCSSLCALTFSTKSQAFNIIIITQHTQLHIIFTV